MPNSNFMFIKIVIRLLYVHTLKYIYNIHVVFRLYNFILFFSILLAIDNIILFAETIINCWKNLKTGYSMNKNIDILSEEIDELLLCKLELIEKKIYENIQMEILLKDGYIELAKAKYIRGKENIGILQVPSNTDMMSLFDLETKLMNENNKTVPCFDVSLKKLNNEVDGSTTDPIKWFGILVPQNLKNSQKRFQESVYLGIKIANIQVQLVSIFAKLKTLYVQKNNLLRQNITS